MKGKEKKGAVDQRTNASSCLRTMSGSSITRYGIVAFREMDTMEKLHTTAESQNAIHTKAKNGNTNGHPMVYDATKNNEKVFPNFLEQITYLLEL